MPRNYKCPKRKETFMKINSILNVNGSPEDGRIERRSKIRWHHEVLEKIQPSVINPKLNQVLAEDEDEISISLSTLSSGFRI